MTENENRIDNVTAILLGAGSGRRMGMPVPKQYLPLCGKPLIAHSLSVFLRSSVISDIVMVVPAGDEDFVKEEIVLPEIRGCGGEGTGKVRAVIPGGDERWNSVAAGIGAVSWPCGYIFIHDGARPLITEESLQLLHGEVLEDGAVIAGMPSKDTVKLTRSGGWIDSTPDRRSVWTAQTPQCFDFELIRDAYARLEKRHGVLDIPVTDDAMVVETMMGRKVRMVPCGYANIKVTTPEDMAIAEALIRMNARQEND